MYLDVEGSIVARYGGDIRELTPQLLGTVPDDAAKLVISKFSWRTTTLYPFLSIVLLLIRTIASPLLFSALFYRVSVDHYKLDMTPEEYLEERNAKVMAGVRDVKLLPGGYRFSTEEVETTS